MLLRLCLCSLIAVFSLQAQGGGRGGGAVFGGIQPARQPGAQAGPPPPPPSDCAVSGTVVNAMTGEPIPRAMVSLGGYDAAGSATDATGHWSISNTSCTGNRTVTATRIGFINSQMALNASGARPVTVNLVSGSPVSGVKISLMPESSIVGKVQDPDGDPVGSARVQALRVQVQAGRRTLVNAAGAPATDSQGNFRIGGLQPGRYVVCASSAEFSYPVGGGPLMKYRDDCFPGPAATGISIAMPVEAGAEIRTALTLTPVAGVHVRGRVTGVPAANRSNVRLVRVPRNLGFEPELSTVVQEDGTFDIRGALPGSYIAIAQTNSPGGSQPVMLQTPVEVGNSDIDNVSFSAQPPGSLSGTVRYQFSNPATVANPPVTLNLRPDPAGAYFGQIPQVQWDANHLNFDFAGIQPSAELHLNAFVNGRITGVYVKSATLRGQDVMDQPFTVDGAVGPLDIVVSDDTGAIDVTVNDSDGHPAVDARIILLSASGHTEFLTSGDDGHALRKNLPTGDYRAWAFDNFTTVPYAEVEWMNQNAGPGEKAAITSGGNVTLTLKLQTAPKE
jgi:hypothetical protein